MTRPTATQKQAKVAAERADTTRQGRHGQSGASSRQPSPTKAYDPLLTIEQVSQWLGVPKGTLYQWRSRHLGPRAIKVGGGLRYRRDDVETYLDQHTDPRTA